MPYPAITDAERILAKGLAQRIKQGMDEKGWNQVELAKAVGMTQGTVSSLLNPKSHRLPLGVYLIRMAQVFGYNLNWFVLGVGPKHRVDDNEPPQAYYVRGELAALARIESAVSGVRKTVLAENAALLDSRLATTLETVRLASMEPTPQASRPSKRHKKRPSSG